MKKTLVVLISVVCTSQIRLPSSFCSLLCSLVAQTWKVTLMRAMAKGSVKGLDAAAVGTGKLWSFFCNCLFFTLQQPVLR